MFTTYLLQAKKSVQPKIKVSQLLVLHDSDHISTRLFRLAVQSSEISQASLKFLF